MRIPKKFAVLLLSLLLTCCGDSREKVQPAGNEVGTVSRFVLENIMEERIVIPDKYRLTDLQGNVFCIKEILSSPKIAVIFHESFCGDCIAEQINVLHSSVDNLQEKVIGFATYSNIRKIKILFKQYDVKFPVYFVPYSDSDLIFGDNNSHNQPYYFYIDHTLSARYVFHPNVYYPKVTTDYLAMCSNLIDDYLRKNESVLLDKNHLFIDNVLKGKELQIKIPYSNRSSENTLYLDSVKVSCDCLKIVSFQKKLSPSETAVLYLTYRPEHPGFDRKQIAFFFKEQGVFNCILKMYVTM